MQIHKRIAVNTNVKGTKRVLELSKCMHNLQVLVHVSTAYANCDRNYITEEVYEPKIIPGSELFLMILCLEYFLELLIPY